jgi:group I intron endonuclease
MFVLYEIKNKETDFRYIGCSKDYENRWVRHKRSLTAKAHHNPHLQNAWNKYGESSFEFSVIKELDSEEFMFLEERELISNSNNLYNIAEGGYGGDVFTNHPNKEEYRQKLSKAQIERNKDPKERETSNVFRGLVGKELEARKKVWSNAKRGNKNSNFRHNTPVKQIDMVTGEVVKVWDYPSLVKEGGFNPKYVMKCCNKHESSKSHKKFLWEWVN